VPRSEREKPATQSRNTVHSKATIGGKTDYNNIRMDLREIWYEGAEGTELVQDGVPGGTV
jgi:hypothetical protein